MKIISVLPFIFCVVSGAPNLRVIPDQLPANLLTLPSNATSIRADISDSFSCEGRSYGYYADVENDCQLFHVCLPITYSNGRQQMFRWSFICPDETMFNQEMFTCTRSDDSIDCAESPRYYQLNLGFGDVTETTHNHEEAIIPQPVLEDSAPVEDVSQNLEDKRAAMESLRRSFNHRNL